MSLDNLRNIRSFSRIKEFQTGRLACAWRNISFRLDVGRRPSMILASDSNRSENRELGPWWYCIKPALGAS
jgi:hypothetical protein